MVGPDFYKGIGAFGLLLLLSLNSDPAKAQTPRPAPTQAERLRGVESQRSTPATAPSQPSSKVTDNRPQAAAVVDSAQGVSRPVELEAAITGEPARPLIQYTYSRPAINFTTSAARFTQRSFYPELRKGTTMEVFSPVIDILDLFPGSESILN